MVIITQFSGKSDQKKFHHFWLPLIYKHNECTFIVEQTTAEQLVYPTGIKNLKVVKSHTDQAYKGPVLFCPLDKIPTYKNMVDLQASKANKVYNDYSELGIFYEESYLSSMGR